MTKMKSDKQKKHPYHGHVRVVHPHWLIAFIIIALCTLTLLVSYAFTIQRAYQNNIIKYGNGTAAVVASELIELSNTARARDNLNLLKVDPLLERAAEAKVRHMVENNYFNHYSPDGTSPWTFMQEVAYQYVAAGENLAVNFTDSEDVVDAWLDSPTHRANIMSTQYSDIGIATMPGTYKGRPAIFVVQMFATPTNEYVTLRAIQEKIAREGRESLSDEESAVKQSGGSKTVEQLELAIPQKFDAVESEEFSPSVRLLNDVEATVWGAIKDMHFDPQSLLLFVFSIIAGLIAVGCMGLLVRKAWHMAHILAFGMCLLILLALGYGLFAMMWQPVIL